MKKQGPPPWGMNQVGWRGAGEWAFMLPAMLAPPDGVALQRFWRGCHGG